MVGSASVAGYVAHVAFWAVLAIGAMFGELGRRGLATFALLWFCGVFGLPRVSVAASFLVTPYVAVLDIVLVFIVFKGDVRMS
jgi:hypothetical protein